MFRTVALQLAQGNTSADATSQLMDVTGKFDREILQRQLAAIQNASAISSKATTIHNFASLGCITPEIVMQVDSASKNLYP